MAIDDNSLEYELVFCLSLNKLAKFEYPNLDCRKIRKVFFVTHKERGKSILKIM